MNPWFGKALFILGFFGIGFFRDPHIKRNRKINVVENRKSGFDYALIAIVTIGGVLLPLLWLFKRSHDDLGTQWSVSLELRENHKLISDGIYKYVRHPMYSSLFLYSASQMFFLPNWIVGPAGVVTFAILFLFRIRSEEQMMLDKFGAEYETYRKLTKRIIPGVW